MTDILKYSNASPVDPFFRLPNLESPTDSLLTPDDFRITTSEAHRYTTFANVGGLPQVVYGSSLTYEIDRNAFQTGETFLRFQRSSLTGTGGATFQRFVDGEGWAMIESVEIYNGSNDFPKMTGMHYFLEKDLIANPQKLIELESNVFINKSTIERDALAASSQELLVDLKPFWADWSKKYLMTGALGSKLTIKINFRSLSDITQTDGTTAPTCTVTKADLWVRSYYVFEDEQRYSIGTTVRDKGLQYRINQWVTQTKDIPSGSTEASIQLTNFKGPCFEFFFIVQDKDTNIDYTPPNPNNSFNTYIDIDNWSLTAGDVEIVKKMPSKINRNMLMKRYHPNVAGMPYIFGEVFSWTPESPIVCGGHKTWNEMTNPTLDIVFPAAISSTYRITVFSHEYNIVVHKGGALRKLFS